jgi:multidrug resistance efflux pump
MAEEKEVEIKTEEVNELLSAVPNWIINWGITIIFVVMLTLLALSFFIKYPDKLAAKITITTVDPPVTLIAKTSGKITELNIVNNQLVKKGDVLLVIENPTDYKSVLKIEKTVRSIAANAFKDTTINFSSIKEWGELGELTPAFLQFLKSYGEYKLFIEVNPEFREIEIIELELSAYQTLQNKYQNQENIYNEEFTLIEKDFNRFNTLFQNKSISAKEFEDKKREYLSAKRNYESMKISNINNNLTVNNLEKNKLQLQMKAYQEKDNYFRELTQSIRSLLSQIETWEQKYLITAPISGKVSLFNFWTKNQNIAEGNVVLSIVQPNKQKVIAKLVVPVANSGKLRLGQLVNIKLNNYQFQEYGMLKGYVKNISLMPQDDNYAIEVALPDRLKTSYNKQLEYKEEMRGSADIITEDLSVFNRVFYEFRKLMNK